MALKARKILVAALLALWLCPDLSQAGSLREEYGRRNPYSEDYCLDWYKIWANAINTPESEKERYRICRDRDDENTYARNSRNENYYNDKGSSPLPDYELPWPNVPVPDYRRTPDNFPGY